MENEIWKDIPGYEGLYQASNMGNIRSLNYKQTGKTRVLKPGLTAKGYYNVKLYKDKESKSKSVHMLVWMAFNGPIPKDMQINHINEIKTDNRLCNLELCTPKYNNNYGTRIKRAAESCKKPILMIDRYTGEIVNNFKSAKDAAKVIADYLTKSVHNCESNINQCLKKKRNTIVAYGYKWEYV